MVLPPLAAPTVKSDTTCDTAELVTDEKFESLPYTAVIECVPAARFDLEYVATLDAIVPELSSVVPS